MRGMLGAVLVVACSSDRFDVPSVADAAPDATTEINVDAAACERRADLDMTCSTPWSAAERPTETLGEGCLQLMPERACFGWRCTAKPEKANCENRPALGDAGIFASYWCCKESSGLP